MKVAEVRKAYLRFFKKRAHVVVPSALLVPENDPTTLFTGSGMQSLVPFLLGESHPAGKRIVNSQQCFRAEDIEEIGDNRHTTFFEMLGNWSLGDYFKEEQLAWFFEFLTKEIGIPKERLWVTCFEGDPKSNLPRDIHSAEIWNKLGIPLERILFYGSKKNWWSRAGMPENMPAGEPGGPDSEVFYEFKDVAHNLKFGPECHVNCDCGRFLEIGNSVFMEYRKAADGGFEKLPERNVDFGGGLERIAAVSEGRQDIFTVDVFVPLIGALERHTSKSYTDVAYTKSFRIVADHIRAAIFMIANGVMPSNTDRGYFVRRLIRRAVRHSDLLGIPQGCFDEFADPIVELYREVYPEVGEKSAFVHSTLALEETKFRKMLVRGLKEFEKFVQKGRLSGYEAFFLFSSYGFPIDMTIDLVSERGIEFNRREFDEAFQKHQDISRTGAENKFKGGLADTSEATTRLHTAHHLLLKTLQIVLGDGVKQRGSNITAKRLRIDFSFGGKMTDEQKRKVEKIVNKKIQEALPVIRSSVPKHEAENFGAEHEFGAKYPDTVSIYSIGPGDASEENPQFEKAFSIEFCGGPHVKNTKEIRGVFTIVKEEALSQGVRRIKAILE